MQKKNNKKNNVDTACYLGNNIGFSLKLSLTSSWAELCFP